MNRFLAASVGWINALMAWLLIVVGILAGVAGAEDLQIEPAIGGVIGGISGFFIAFYICGLLSLFIEIRKELIKIGSILAGDLRPNTEGTERGTRVAEPSIE